MKLQNMMLRKGNQLQKATYCIPFIWDVLNRKTYTAKYGFRIVGFRREYKYTTVKGMRFLSR
jgi:hypothetical protein